MNDLIIETSNLTKVYGKQKAVDNLNLHIYKGKIYGLLGRNGAGKTTTMKMILDLISPSSGNVYLWGKEISSNKSTILSNVGSLIEAPGFYHNLTARENLEIFASLRKIENKESSIKKCLELVGLSYNDKKTFSQYSMGMKQRLAIALTIMHNPDLLILDEPTNGLDPIGIYEMRKFIRNLCEQEKKTILISTHILSEIELLADDIGIIDQGKLIMENTKEDIKKMRQEYIEVSVLNIEMAKSILNELSYVHDYEVVSENKIRIPEKGVIPYKLNEDLITNKIEVNEIHLVRESMEEFFVKVTGGEGIA